MSENYQYTDCKHCGQSVMEGQIHNCRQMLLAGIADCHATMLRQAQQIDHWKEQAAIYKDQKQDWQEELERWKKKAQHLFGIMHNDILSAMEDCIELNMSAEQMRDVLSYIIGKTLADRP